MKVAISSKGPERTDEMDMRFGRAPFFVTVNTENMKYGSLKNDKAGGMGGVGPQVVQMLAEIEIDKIITGNLGPNALKTIIAAGIQAFQYQGTVEDAVDCLMKGELNQIENKTVEGHW